jgi:MurNAc alpha-1-phosphate uridylyltransferase
MQSPADTCVFILAAGRGERMRPLTDHIPKPLLPVAGRPLIEHHLVRLAGSGFRNVVINHAHLGEKIVSSLGDGSRFGLEIQYSSERDAALETAGGIVNALPKISGDPFICINADIWTDFNFVDLLTPMEGLARLVMVDNPAHHLEGDFSIGNESSLTLEPSDNKLTFSGIALYRRAAFLNLVPEYRPLLPLLRQWIEQGEVEYLHHDGVWLDIGTAKRLQQVEELVTR